jgi:methyl-accepting chemotaxis protein
MSSHESEFDRGLKEGRIDALLQAHSEHLGRLNGNVEKFGLSNEALAAAIRELASEIRTLQEEGRLAEERVNVAATTLARETERRREELATAATAASTVEQSAERKFSKRERLIALAITVILAVIGFYLARHAIPGAAGRK